MSDTSSVKGRYFSPDAIQLSKFHFYSLGIVAANKALSSKVIEVTPTEELPMLNGEINSTQVTVTAKGQDGSGANYSTSVQTANSIQATWLKLSVSNRLTAPDVRRGEAVMLYQFADSDNFFWTTLKDDMQLRRLETVVYGWSGSATTSDLSDTELNGTNMYYLEVSTHQGLVAFHTSKGNGEPFGYDIQINTKEGRVVITDDAKNFFVLDSQAHQLHLENVDGSYIDLTKQIATIFTKDQITIQTQTLTAKATTMNFTATTGTYKITNFSVQGTVMNFQQSASFNAAAPTIGFNGTLGMTGGNATMTVPSLTVISNNISLGS